MVMNVFLLFDHNLITAGHHKYRFSGLLFCAHLVCFRGVHPWKSCYGFLQSCEGSRRFPHELWWLDKFLKRKLLSSFFLVLSFGFLIFVTFMHECAIICTRVCAYMYICLCMILGFWITYFVLVQST